MPTRAAFGLCSPLLLTRSGQKMGKSEKGAVYLDPALTSPFDFYQYWINDDDALVVDHLRWLTTLGQEEVEAIAAEHAARPEARVGAAGAGARPHRRASTDPRRPSARRAWRRRPSPRPSTTRRCWTALFDALEHFEFGPEADGLDGARPRGRGLGLVTGRGPPAHRPGRRLDQRGAA